MPQYRYFTAEQIEESLRDVEQVLDQRYQQQREAAQLARLQAFIDANPEVIANDPLVRALRQIPSRGDTAASPTPPAAPAARQRSAAPPAKAATLPVVIDGNARFHPSHLKMRPATPQIDSVKDSYVHSPGSTIRQR